MLFRLLMCCFLVVKTLVSYAQFKGGAFDFESDATNLFSRDGKLWVSTANNGLFVSDDQGKTWVKQWRLNNATIVSRLENNGVLKVNQITPYQSAFWGCTDHGLYRSVDEGKNWTLVKNFQYQKYGNSSEASVLRIVFAPNKFVVQLSQGLISTSTDGGSTWTVPQKVAEAVADSNYPTNPDIVPSQYFTWADNKWYLLTAKRLLISSDDMQTWQNTSLSVTNRIASSVFVEAGQLVVSASGDSLRDYTYYGKSSTLYCSKDGGQSWDWSTSLAVGGDYGVPLPVGFYVYDGTIYATLPGDVLRRQLTQTTWSSIQVGTAGPTRGGIQANPLIIGGTAYVFVREPTTRTFDYTYRLYRRPLSELSAPFFASPILPTLTEYSDYRNMLKWLDESNDEDGFDIERSNRDTTMFQLIGRVGSGITTFTDAQIEIGVSYYYRIRARKGASYSAYSTILRSTRSSSCFQYKTQDSPRRIVRVKDASMYALAGDELMLSMDGGQRWKPVNVCDGGFANYSDLSFPSLNSGFLVVRGQANLLKTTDGGVSWQHLMPIMPTSSMKSVAVHFLTDSIGYVLAKQTAYNVGYSLLKTKNGGVSFESLPNTTPLFQIDDSGLQPLLRLKPSFIVDSTIVGITPDNTYSPGRLVISTDAGTTWQWRSLPSNGTFSRQLYALSANNIWLLGRNGAGQYQYSDNVLHTTDGGLTWTTIPLPDRVDDQYTPIQLYDIQFADSQHGFILGGRAGTFSGPGEGPDEGFIYKTSDGGVSWQIVNTGAIIDIIPRKVVALGPQVAIFSQGSDNQHLNKLVLTSTNFGASWERIEADALNPQNIVFCTPEKGYVVGTSYQLKQGYYGKFYSYSRVNFYHKTTDGGITWKKESLPTTEGLFEVNFLDANIGFISSEQSVWVTTDGGQSWQPKMTPAPFLPEVNSDEVLRPIKRSYFINATTWLRVSNDYRTFKTVDGGNTWAQLSTPQFTRFPQFSFVSGNIGYCTGIEGPANGQVYKTMDGGQSWTLVGHGGGVASSPSAILFLTEQKGFMSDNTGLRTTYDGGKTWPNRIPMVGSGQFMFASGKIGYYASSLYYSVLQTSDGGDTWHTLPSGSPIGGDGPTALIDSTTLYSYNRSFRIGSPLCQPVSPDGDTIRCESVYSQAVLYVQAGSFDQQISYQWYRAADDSPVVGQISATLSLTSMPAQGMQEFYCVIKNNCSTSRSNRLTILGKSAICTRKAGNWNDPTVWSCNRIPTSDDRVYLKHSLVIPNQYQARAGVISFYSPKVRLRYTGQAVVKMTSQ